MSRPPRSTPRPGQETPFDAAVRRVAAGADPSDEAATIVAAMTDEERFGVPAFEVADGPRGCVIGNATAFPVPLARGATFDPALEEEIGAAIGAESRASGATISCAICVDLLRHPSWGHTSETYGEDPLHVGEMAAAASRGLQRHVLACMKHSGLDPMEEARFQDDATVSERTLHEVYLPHVRRVAREGVVAVGLGVDDVDRVATRVVAALLRFRHLLDPASAPPASVLASPAHRELARRASAASMVLLGNDGDLLPLDPSAPGRIVVLGPLADVADLGEGGSSDVQSPTTVTPFEGIRSAFGRSEVVHHHGCDAQGTIAGVDALVHGAATVIVVVGCTKHDEGEYVDESLIAAAAASHDRVIVVVVAGSAVVIPWADTVGAVLLSWQPGTEGGAALGDVLSGRSEPGGRLPFAVPRDEVDLVPFDRDAAAITADLLHGQWWLDHRDVEPHFAFGAGQGYTTWDLVTASVSPNLDDPGGVTAHVTVDVRNTGARDGSTVLFVFAGLPDSDVVRPPRRLVGFRRVHERAGGSARVVVPVDLGHLDVRLDGRWSREPGSYHLEVCRRAGDPAAVHLDVTVA